MNKLSEMPPDSPPPWAVVLPVFVLKKMADPRLLPLDVVVLSMLYWKAGRIGRYANVTADRETTDVWDLHVITFLPMQRAIDRLLLVGCLNVVERAAVLQKYEPFHLVFNLPEDGDPFKFEYHESFYDSQEVRDGRT